MSFCARLKVEGYCRPLKILMLIMCFLSFLFGVILTIVSVYALNDQRVLTLTNETLPTGTLAVGTLLFLAQIIGVVAVCFKDGTERRKVATVSYVVFQSILVLATLCAGTAVLVAKSYSYRLVNDAWIQLGSSPVSNDTIGAFQRRYDCCGLQAWNDVWAYGNCTQPPEDVLAHRPCADIAMRSFEKLFQRAGACGMAFGFILIFNLGGVAYLLDRERFDRSLPGHHMVKLDEIEDEGRSAPPLTSINSVAAPEDTFGDPEPLR
jgi:lysylphosphatidylglycerol synthetase-like protein (DUF2156 family)